MPYNEDKSIYTTSPREANCRKAEANCRKAEATASLPLSVGRYLDKGTLKEIHVWDRVEGKMYELDANDASKYINDFFRTYLVLSYKRAKPICRTKPVVADVTLTLTVDEIKIIKKVLKEAEGKLNAAT